MVKLDKLFVVAMVLAAGVCFGAVDDANVMSSAGQQEGYPEELERCNPLIVLPSVAQVFNSSASQQSNVWHVFPVRVERRDEFHAHLAAKGIQTVIHYPIPPHRQPAYAEWRGLSLPITEKIHETVISLPLSPVMEEDEVSEVIAAVNGWKGDLRGIG